MNPFYEWLYDHYAAPTLSDSTFPEPYQAQKRAWLTAAQRLPQRDRLLATNLFDSLKLHWGTQAFARGVQVGLQLSAAFAEEAPGRS